MRLYRGVVQFNRRLKKSGRPTPTNTPMDSVIICSGLFSNPIKRSMPLLLKKYCLHGAILPSSLSILSLV